MPRPFLLSSTIVGAFFLFAVTTGVTPPSKPQGPPGVVSSNEVTQRFKGIAPWSETETYVKLPPKPMTVAETRVWLKLQEKVAMDFPNDTPLVELINHIEKSTIDKTDFLDGIPIYVDPQGLQDADKTMESTIKIRVKGIPLATTLKLALRQLNLAYWVHPDGLLIITSTLSEDQPFDSDEMIQRDLDKILMSLLTIRNEIRITNGMKPLIPAPSSVQTPQPAK